MVANGTVAERGTNGRAVTESGHGMTQDQIDLLKRTLCKDLTNDEFSLFCGQCRRTGLDPFARQIHAVKRSGRLVIQTGIDGFRLIAERTNETDGQDGPFWCGADGVWKDVWLEADAPPSAAKVIVYRRGQSRGYTGVARWVEYNQGTGCWPKLQSTMLAKVAESIALRKAFPQELSGLYTTDEMAQAEREDAPAVRHDPVVHQTSAIVNGGPAPSMMRVELLATLKQIGEMEKKTPEAMALELCGAMGIPNIDALPAERLEAACNSARKRFARLQAAAEAEPAVVPLPKADEHPVIQKEERYIGQDDEEPEPVPVAAKPAAQFAQKLPGDVVNQLITAMAEAGMTWQQVTGNGMAIIGRRLTADAQLSHLKLEEAARLKEHCQKAKVARQSKEIVPA